MTAADKTQIARRPLLAGLVGALALAGIIALEVPKAFPGLFARRYPPSPFDDLLALLPDRENAVRLGAAPGDASRQRNAQIVAERLRSKIGGHSLAVILAGDLAENRLAEVQGWLLPESLADLCDLAAIAEPQ